MVKNLIVGIDPGTTAGIAVLDIDGRLLYLASKRDLKKNELVRIVIKFGRPLVLATDVTPVPRSIEKLASAFGCKIFYPEKPFLVLEKQELVKEFGCRVKDEHEADALAACLKAWKGYRKFFAKTKRLLAERDSLDLFEEVTLKLLKEGSENVESAVDEILGKSKKEEEVKLPSDVDLKKLEKILHEKEKELQELRKQVELLTRALGKERLGSKVLEKLKVSLAQTEEYKKELTELTKANELLKKFERLRTTELEPLVELESISGLELEKLDRLIGLYGRTVYCNSLDNVTVLNSFGIKALLTESDMNLDLGKVEFPVVRIPGEAVQSVEGVKAVSEEYLEKVLTEARKDGLMRWLENYRKRKKNY